MRKTKNKNLFFFIFTTPLITLSGNANAMANLEGLAIFAVPLHALVFFACIASIIVSIGLTIYIIIKEYKKRQLSFVPILMIAGTIILIPIAAKYAKSNYFDFMGALGILMK